VSGGRDTTFRWGGTSELVLKLDSQKLGLWPGGFFLARADVAFKHDVNGNTGALMPVNTAIVLPLPAHEEVVLSHVIFTQFLTEWFGVSIGKLDTTGGDMNEFAHIKGNQFMNLAFSASPLVLRTAPYATLGMGLVILPTKNPEEAVVGFSVIDTEGTTTRSGFDTLFKDGTTLAAEGRLTIKPFGLLGHQLIGGAWSNKDFNSLNQDRRTLLRNILRGTPLSTEDDSWAVYYNFDQYLYMRPGKVPQGFGIFGRLGISDGKANAFHRFYSIGFGAKGMLPGRENDQFGIGYYYLDITDDLQPIVRRRLLRGHEQGVEAYYNLAVAPWLHVTPDLQIIDPARRGTDTAVVPGFRIKIEF
jgi:porin